VNNVIEKQTKDEEKRL